MCTLQFIIEYDGTHFSGWQTQPQKRTIQKTLEEILGQITQERVTVIGASRTDAGVHALGQVAHTRLRSRVSCRKLLGAMNALLPPDVVVKSVSEAVLDFHAQNQAKKKTYRYSIWNDRVRSPLQEQFSWHVWDPLHLPAMRRGAKCLVGRHDFAAFRGAQSDTKTSMRTVQTIKIGQGQPKGMIQIEISGNGFLKYMVRNIVGTLVDVGKGRLRPKDIGRILHSKDRQRAGRTAPARGLCLVSVNY